MGTTGNKKKFSLKKIDSFPDQIVKYQSFRFVSYFSRLSYRSSQYSLNVMCWNYLNLFIELFVDDFLRISFGNFLRRSVTVLLYRRHRRKMFKRVCEILTHHDRTGMSLPSVVKAWTNLPTRLQFDDYLFIYLWNEIIDVSKDVFLYHLVEYNSVLYISGMGM